MTIEEMFMDLKSTMAKLQAERGNVPFEHVIWDTHDVAVYLKLAYSTVRDTILVQPGFPKPVREAKGRAPAAYKATEVVAWEEARQSKQ